MQTFKQFITENDQDIIDQIQIRKIQNDDDGMAFWRILQDPDSHFGDSKIIPSKKVQLVAVKHDMFNTKDLIIAAEKMHVKIDDDVLRAAVEAFPAAVKFVVPFMDNPPKDWVQQALTDEKWIKYKRHLTEPELNDYDTFVKHYFKGNTILMNKWLRYAQNIRELG
jgi:hypothetical protein